MPILRCLPNPSNQVTSLTKPERKCTPLWWSGPTPGVGAVGLGGSIRNRTSCWPASSHLGRPARIGSACLSTSSVGLQRLDPTQLHINPKKIQLQTELVLAPRHQSKEKTNNIQNLGVARTQTPHTHIAKPALRRTSSARWRSTAATASACRL